MNRIRALLVDGDDGSRAEIRDFLGANGLRVEEAGNVAVAEKRFAASPPDIVIVNYLLPDGDAKGLNTRLARIGHEVPALILATVETLEQAVSTLAVSVDALLTKPVGLPALLIMIERLVENHRARQAAQVIQALKRDSEVDPFLGTSDAIRRLAHDCRRAAGTESPILIQGETGSGKGVLACWLHRNGPRAQTPIVDFNCAGFSRELLESELFGHMKGAFTGAAATKPGLLEVAHGGTVFLDEIGDLDVAVQAKLLKVIEEKRFRRVGAVEDRVVDIHLVTATHSDLAVLVQQQRFRADLFYRINVIQLHVPPLRERPEDIPLIARDLLDRLEGELGRPGVRISPQALAALRAYSWPGNIRELRNVLERGLLQSGGRTLMPEHFALTRVPHRAGLSPQSPQMTLLQVEREYIVQTVADVGGNVGSAAQRLGIPRSSLYAKMRRFGLPTPRKG